MYVRVSVQTNAKSDTVHDISDGRLRITTREPAADNRANIRVRELVARRYNIPLAAVQIVSGHHRPNKMLMIRNDAEQ